MKNKPCPYDMLVITGPTASGKTALAASVAAITGGEVVSADSRQVYRGMDIGTGKDYDDYIVDGKRVPHHLTDVVDAGYKYNVFEYQRDFAGVYRKLKERSVFPVVCGGSGMYVDSIIRGYNLAEVPPDTDLRQRLEMKSMEELTAILAGYRKLHNTTDIDSKKRVIRAIEIEQHNRIHGNGFSSFAAPHSLITGIMLDREERRKRITRRLRQRLSSGLIEEVEKLLHNGISEDTLIYYGLEYKYITLYLTGKTTYDDMVSSLETAIHQFAKRQMTWFRGMERKGTVIHWIDGTMEISRMTEQVISLLTGKKL